jgi:hypothetical protein
MHGPAPSNTPAEIPIAYAWRSPSAFESTLTLDAGTGPTNWNLVWSDELVDQP